MLVENFPGGAAAPGLQAQNAQPGHFMLFFFTKK